MRHSRFLLLILLGALFVAACGSSVTPVPPTVTQPPATATTAPTNTPAPLPTEAATATTAPTATPAQAASGACLIGKTWQLTNMTDYFKGVMAQASNGAEFVGQSGTVTYIFGNDGVATVEADNFQMKLQIKVQGTAVDIIVSIKGRATANYTLTEPDQITFSSPQIGDLNFSATVNGTEVLSGTPAEMAAMFGVSPESRYSTFTYTCNDTTLSYTPPVENAQPIIFERVP